MQVMSTVSFAVEPLSTDEPVLSIVPAVDGVRLTDLVAEFERTHHYEPAGGYAGLVPSFFRLGRVDEYFMGISADPVLSSRGHWLLGCDCGEAGCWPLEARIVCDGPTQVTWEQFKQPFRPERDYSSFGPFRFDFEQYRRSLTELKAKFPAE